MNRTFHKTSLTVISVFSMISLISCGEKSPVSLISEGFKNDNLRLSNTDEYISQNCLNSIGNQKILVVPVVFKNEREFTSSELEMLNNALFKDSLMSEENKHYYSLKEYYSMSSLGKLTIDGEIAPTIHVSDSTIDELFTNKAYLPRICADIMYEDTVNFSNEYLKKYDTNSDGIIDSVIFVYSAPTDITKNCWAYCDSFEVEKNTSRPNISKHMFIGIDFFSSTTWNIDTHCVIHETGHLLGSRDYYPTDNMYVALGGQSMMDYNISDHDPYTKSLFGWATPMYYDFKDSNEITIDLPKMVDTNKFILLKDNWNGSPLDEYLVVEYYSPEKLNYPDSKYQYYSSFATDRPFGFRNAGIKIYHVDARVAKCLLDESKNPSFVQYVNEIPANRSEQDWYTIGASNSNSDSLTDSSRKGRYKEIALIENKKFNYLQSGGFADEQSLFYEGDVFDSSNTVYINNNSFNSGGKINYKVKVNSLGDKYANITIEHFVEA